MRDSKEILDILIQFQPKIKKSLNNTHYQEREDLEQEIKIKIIEKLTTINFRESPDFWDLIE